MNMYCCGSVPTAAAMACHLAEHRAVVICTGGCASSDARLAETRTVKAHQ